MSCLSPARAMKHELHESQGQVHHPGTSAPQNTWGENPSSEKQTPADTPEGALHQPLGEMFTPHTDLPSLRAFPQRYRSCFS